MNHIGIITAMAVEFEQIVCLLSEVSTRRIGIHDFTTGRLGDAQVVLMQCGIGKVNAAVGAAAMIAHFAPRAVVSTGVAGGIDASLRVMDVVASSAVVYHDVWCGDGCAYGQVQGLPECFEGGSELLGAVSRLVSERSEGEGSRVVMGLIATGDQFVTSVDDLQRIKTKFPDAIAVDMESAAIAQTCYLYATPFVSFRIVSDTPGVDDHWQQYNDFWGEMANRSFGVTKRFLELLVG